MCNFFCDMRQYCNVQVKHNSFFFLFERFHNFDSSLLHYEKNMDVGAGTGLILKALDLDPAT